jgi:hypothetical protein
VSDTAGTASGPLTTASVLRCPHGGTVRPAQGAPAPVRIAGAPVATAGDVFTVTGCPHSEDGRPRPCTTVRFNPDTGTGGTGGARVLVAGRPVLTTRTAAQCFSADLTPHGPPVAGDAPQGVSCR